MRVHENSIEYTRRGNEQRSSGDKPNLSILDLRFLKCQRRSSIHIAPTFPESTCMLHAWVHHMCTMLMHGYTLIVKHCDTISLPHSPPFPQINLYTRSAVWCDSLGDTLAGSPAPTVLCFITVFIISFFLPSLCIIYLFFTHLPFTSTCMSMNPFVYQPGI